MNDGGMMHGATRLQTKHKKRTAQFDFKGKAQGMHPGMSHEDFGKSMHGDKGKTMDGAMASHGSMGKNSGG